MEALIAALRSAPYAYLTSEDVDKMVRTLDTCPAAVVETLYGDADCHAECGNQIKADAINALATHIARAGFAAEVERVDKMIAKLDNGGA